MADWLVVVLAVIGVPLALILGGLSVVGLAIWVSHRRKMATLEIEEKERQAEFDRDLLGLTGKDMSVHIETILGRLKTVEGRLDRVESMQDIETAKTRGRIPIGSVEEEEEPGRDQRAEQEEQS